MGTSKSYTICRMLYAMQLIMHSALEIASGCMSSRGSVERSSLPDNQTLLTADPELIHAWGRIEVGQCMEMQ